MENSSKESIDFDKLFKAFISTQQKSKQPFSLGYQDLELNGKTFYIAYNSNNEKDAKYIKTLSEIMSRANDEQKSNQIKRLYRDPRFAVAKFNKNGGLTKLHYEESGFRVVESGSFNDTYKILTGFIKKYSELLKIDCSMQKERGCIQQAFYYTSELVIISTGKHENNKKNIGFSLTDGIIRIQKIRGDSFTNIAFRNNRITSLESYQPRESDSPSYHYVDLEKKEFFVIVYKDRKPIKINLNFSELIRTHNPSKENEPFSLDSKFHERISVFTKAIEESIKTQTSKIFKNQDDARLTNKVESIDSIDSLVAYIDGKVDGKERKKKIGGSRPATQPTQPDRDENRACSAASGDAEQDAQHDPDNYILQWWQLQKKTNEPQKESPSPPSRTFKPKFTLLEKIVPELNLLKDALLIDTPATESSASAPAPATESSAPAPAPATESSASAPAPATESSAPAPAPATESSASAPAPATESLVKDSATPSNTPSLPKASDFYKTWENYFVTEVLQAIANILNEGKRGFTISDDKKNESYELLHSLMTTMSFGDLCEGLALSEEKQEILLQKLLTKSQANFSREMAEIANREAMQKAYKDWTNGKALQEQAKDMQREP